MSDFMEGVMAGVIVTLLAAATISCVVCSCVSDSWERAAVEHNAAEYDSKTGEWKWKESP
jgi:hypothetical protein